MKRNKVNLFIFAIQMAILIPIKSKAMPNFHLENYVDATSISEPAPSVRYFFLSRY